MERFELNKAILGLCQRSRAGGNEGIQWLELNINRRACAHLFSCMALRSNKRPKSTLMNAHFYKRCNFKDFLIDIYNYTICCCAACAQKLNSKFGREKRKPAEKQAAFRTASAQQQCSNSWPTKLENERLHILYSSLLPVYIIPTVSHQAARMKSFHQLPVENLFSLKPNTVAKHAHRCSTFTKRWIGSLTHLNVKSKVKVSVLGRQRPFERGWVGYSSASQYASLITTAAARDNKWGESFTRWKDCSSTGRDILVWDESSCP